MEASCSRSSSGVGFDLGLIQCQWTPYRARVGPVRQSAETGQNRHPFWPAWISTAPRRAALGGVQLSGHQEKMPGRPPSRCHHLLSYPQAGTALP